MARPAVIIGLGGTGQWVLTYVKKDLLETHNGQLPRNVRLLVFDTMPQATVETAQAGGEKEVKVGTIKLETGTEFIHLGGNIFDLAMQVKEGRHPHLGSWFQADHYVRNLPPASFNLSAGAGKIRQFGRMAVFHDLTRPAASEVWSRLQTAVGSVQREVTDKTQLEIIIVGSFAGGTGAGILVDMALLSRACATIAVQQNHIVRGFFVLPRAFATVGGEMESRRMQARSFATWRELNRFMIVSKDLGLRRMDYHATYQPFQIPIEKRAFDVCYLVDPARADNPLTGIDPELGVFPIIADTISAILDSTAGQKYTEWVTSSLTNSFNAHPGVPLHSAIGTYTEKVPIYYTMQEFSHNFALDLLDVLLVPVKKDGRVVGVSEAKNTEAEGGLGQPGRNEVLRFLERSSITRRGEVTVDNTLFPGKIADIVRRKGPDNTEEIKAHAEGSISGGRRGDPARDWLTAFVSLGDAEDARKLRAEIEDVLQLPLVRVVPPSRVFKDHPREAIFRFKEKIPRFIDEQYGIRLPDGTETRGKFGGALERCRDFQVARFDAMLRLWLLNTLQGVREDPIQARGGKLGYAYDFLDGMVNVFEQFLLFMRKVQEMREELGRHRELEERKERMRQVMERCASWKFLFVFTSPRAYSSQDAYLDAVQRGIDLRKDELLHEIVREMAERMQDHCKQAREEIRRWIMALATGDVPTRVTGVYEAVDRSLSQVKSTREADRRLDRVQHLLEDVPYQRNEALVRQALGLMNWDVKFDAKGFQIGCWLDVPGVEEKDKPRLGAGTAKDMAGLLGFCERQFGNLPEEKKIATVLAGRYDDGIALATDLRGKAEPLFLGAPGAMEAELRSNHIRVSYTFDDQVRKKFQEAEGQLRRFDPAMGGNIRLVESDDKHKLTLVRSDDVIRSEDFAMWDDCWNAYEQEINDPNNPQDARLYHIFPAEVNAAGYEQQLRKLGQTYRVFDPKVVMVLEDKEKARDLFLCWAHGFIKLFTDPKRDEIAYRLELPGRDLLYLTAPAQARPDVFFVVNNFVLIGADARPGVRMNINYDRVRQTIRDRQRDLGPEKTVALLQEAIEKGLVAELKTKSEQMVEEAERANADPRVLARLGQEYRDLADLAHLMFLEVISDTKSRQEGAWGAKPEQPAAPGAVAEKPTQPVASENLSSPAQAEEAPQK